MLGWIGVTLGALAVAGSLTILLVGRSMPQRVPTSGDFATSCGLFVASGAVLVVLLAGLGCSLAGLIVARKRGLSVAASAIGLGLNVLPVLFAFAYDILFTRGLL